MNKKVVIIGGGVSGLSAGIYCQLNGFDTEIFEMNNLPGGQCTAWDRKGYRFDYCLHWLVGTASGPFHSIWKTTGVLNENIKVINQAIHTKIVDEKEGEFIIYSDIIRWEKYLIEMAPEDSVAIKKMCSDMQKTSRLQPFANPAELRSVSDYLTSFLKIIPTLSILIKYGKKTCNEYFKGLKLTNKRLIFFLQSIFGENDFSALVFLMMLGWFHQKNAGYLLGGSLPLSIRMAEKFKSLGGTLYLVKKVDKIIVNNGIAKGVLLHDGEIIDADYVISAADGYATIFKMLEGKYQSEQIKTAYSTWPLFTPIVQVSFGIDKEINSGVANQTILSNGLRIGKTVLKNGYSLMNYSFDATMAPKGKTVLVIRFESPWSLWEDLIGEDYKAEKRQIENDALALLEEKYPGVSAFVEKIDVATPKTTVRYTGVWKGAYEGFLPSSTNISKTIKMTLPGLDNFYMCGQWLFPGGGLPPAAQSGKWAAQLICKKERKEFVE
ncbi:MAG: NAD(P)/FAD-dependent oxidoreductase [Bacteroidetes bacterium]|nr:NAD(P)/FAD-dependent oxidoreductase [Bacteroidota bacterium]